MWGGVMSVNDVVTFINGVGFPIAVCIFLVWYIIHDKKRRQEERKEREEQREKERKSYEEHQTELYMKLSQSVDNNTTALNNLILKLEGRMDNG